MIDQTQQYNCNCLTYTWPRAQIKTDPVDPYYAPYFAGKKRMFEIMVRGHLKQIDPNDRIYVGMESGVSAGDAPILLLPSSVTVGSQDTVLVDSGKCAAIWLYR